MLAISTLDCSRNDVGDIATGLRLGDSDTAALLARKQIGQESLLELGTAELDDWRDSKGKPGIQGASRAAEA